MRTPVKAKKTSKSFRPPPAKEGQSSSTATDTLNVNSISYDTESETIISNLKRIDVVTHLHQNLKICPKNAEFSKIYCEYVCSQLAIDRKQLHLEAVIDISKIKRAYVECKYSVPQMLKSKKYKNFFNGPIKLKRLPNPSASDESEMVCYSF